MPCVMPLLNSANAALRLAETVTYGLVDRGCPYIFAWHRSMKCIVIASWAKQLNLF